MIIIDSNSLCYSAFFKTGHLSYEGEKTGIIFGFLKEILKIKKQFPSFSPIIFVWDSKENVRKKIYPIYKGNRGKTKKLLKKEDYEQFVKLRKEVLPSLGFKNIYIKTGYEADDIIAILCKKYKKDRKIIVSTDQDLYQLLNKNTIMWKAQAKKLYTVEKFEKEYGIDAGSWNQVKALAGCSSDNVRGIPGVGEKTAIRILLWDIEQEPFLGKENSRFRKLMDKKYELNLKLVSLPFTDFKIAIPQQDDFNIEELRMLALRLSFYSINNSLNQWKIFKKEKNNGKKEKESRSNQKNDQGNAERTGRSNGRVFGF